MLGCVLLVAGAACKDKAAEPQPDKPAPGERAVSDRPSPSAPAAAPEEDFAGVLHNLGMWSEMHAYCGWKAEPFKDLKARLFATPKLAAAKARLEVYFDRGAGYGSNEAKKRDEQKAKGETPSAWACGADVEASVRKEIDRLLSAR